MDSILYQSVRDANGNAVQQLSNLNLTGLTTISGQAQHDHGKLYGQFVHVTGSTTITTPQDQYTFSISGQAGYLLVLYSDATMMSPVATASWTAPGMATIQQQNNSGLGGTVNMVSFTANDTSIEAICLLSQDDDLPMDDLTTLSEYDSTTGLATFHAQAFAYVTDFVKRRAKTNIWNPTMFDTASVNGAVGGYDLSKVLNWQSQGLIEASAQYAFFKIAERQYLEPGSTWDIRSKEARNLVRAHLEDAELAFDSTGNRVETRGRSLASWKISRA